MKVEVRRLRMNRRQLRLVSGLVLLSYMVVHLGNHALGLLSFDAAERMLAFWVSVWHSRPGTALLYGAAAIHVLLAFVAVHEKAQRKLPPIELVRIAAGFSIPLLLVAHLASTRVAFELHHTSSTYLRVIGTIWAAHGEARQLALLVPGWLHGCLGVYLAFRSRRWFARVRGLLLATAVALPIFAGLGFLKMAAEVEARGIDTTQAQTSAASIRLTLVAFYGIGFLAVFASLWARKRKTSA